MATFGSVDSLCTEINRSLETNSPRMLRVEYNKGSGECRIFLNGQLVESVPIRKAQGVDVLGYVKGSIVSTYVPSGVTNSGNISYFTAIPDPNPS